MLTPADNELLVRTGPGTAMGDLFRRFWAPVALVSELGDPDDPPVAIRVLGEDFVAFRDSNGEIGLLDAYCPHRRANLFWGRNEGAGLRCVYHGWKFDVAGRCVDLPNAPDGPTLKNKVTMRPYPTLDRGGILWAYFGPPELQPPFPEIEGLHVPADRRYVTKIVTDANYAQVQEGDIDSSHVAFLHRTFDGAGVAGGRVDPTTFADTQPRWFPTVMPYGLMLAAQRKAPDEQWHWRVNQFLMPYVVIIATPAGVPVLHQIRVPIDDAHSLHFRYWALPERPFDERDYAMFDDGVTVPEMIPGTFRMQEDITNRYQIDRQKQKHSNYTGIRSFVAQDLAVTQDQGGLGTIADRSREYLTSSDRAIITWRKRLITSAKVLAAGSEPPEATNPSAYLVRSGDFKAPRSVTIEDAARERLFPATA
jgi:phenylpropionate dioxygenase-like ring-hydroxylating dioxygenase large terminal subunit